jgi:hypothetical protein
METQWGYTVKGVEIIIRHCKTNICTVKSVSHAFHVPFMETRWDFTGKPADFRIRR